MLWGTTGSLGSRRCSSLSKDVGSEEEPIVDVESLHWVAEVRVGAPPLKEEHQFGLIEPDVMHVLERILNMLARNLVKEVVLSLLLASLFPQVGLRARASVHFL